MKKPTSAKPKTAGELSRYQRAMETTERAVELCKERVKQAKSELKAARVDRDQAKALAKEAARTFKAARRYFRKHSGKSPGQGEVKKGMKAKPQPSEKRASG